MLNFFFSAHRLLRPGLLGPPTLAKRAPPVRNPNHTPKPHQQGKARTPLSPPHGLLSLASDGRRQRHELRFRQPPGIGIPEGVRHGVAQRVATRASAVHGLSLVHVRLDAHTLRHKLGRQRRLEAATLGWQGGRWLSGGSSSSEWKILLLLMRPWAVVWWFDIITGELT